MLPNIPGLGNLQKQMQKMQEDMAALQIVLENTQIESVAGGGMVRAIVNGQGKIVSVTIAPEVVDPSDIEMLQDLVVTAVGDATAKAEEHRTSEMNKVTGGVMGSLPKGLF